MVVFQNDQPGQERLLCPKDGYVDLRTLCGPGNHRFAKSRILCGYRTHQPGSCGTHGVDRERICTDLGYFPATRHGVRDRFVHHECRSWWADLLFCDRIRSGDDGELSSDFHHVRVYVCVSMARDGIGYACREDRWRLRLKNF